VTIAPRNSGSGGTPGPLWPLMLPSSKQGLDSMCAETAHGVRVRFADGQECLAGTSGLWNANLGFGNVAIAEAAAAALRDASYLSVWGYENAYARQAAAELVDVAGADRFARVLFATSGGSANDMAMKLVRHVHVLRGEARRRGIVGLRDGYHGLTYGAFALTDARLGHEMYGVDRRLVGHVPANDPDALSALLDRADGRIAAMVVEPVIGTAAVPLTDEYVAAVLDLRREHGFLLVADEVSTGFGRIGTALFASSVWPEQPDILITAKGLTNGTMAAAAVLVSHEVAAAFIEGDAILGHAETQAGTPVACAAISAMISEMARLDAVAASARLGRRLDSLLARLEDEIDIVTATTGAGCLRAVRLGDDDRPLPQEEVPAVVAAIRDAGALVHPGPSCIQLLPALIYADDDLNALMRCVTEGIAAHGRRR